MDRSDENTPRKSPYPTADKPELLCCPVYVGFIHPFRLLVDRDDEPWCATPTQLNTQTYDYVRLARICGGSDVGLESPFHMLWGCDGSLILPALPQFALPETALDFINKQLAALLIGGIYCEANRLEDLESGTLLDWEFVRLSGSGTGSIAHFHNSARLACMSGLEVVRLFQPNAVPYAKVHSAHCSGRAVLSNAPNLTPEILLQGVSALVKRDWNSALIGLWIAIEQLTSHHWVRWIDGNKKTSFAARNRQFDDARVWTTALRQEMLFQEGLFGKDVLEYLFAARQARNKLAHEGAAPSQAAVKKAMLALRGLMLPIGDGKSIGLFDLDLDARQLVKIGEEPPGPIKPIAWRTFPKLPREEAIWRRYRNFQKGK